MNKIYQTDEKNKQRNTIKNVGKYSKKFGALNGVRDLKLSTWRQWIVWRFKFRFGYLVQSRVLPWKISVKNSYQNRSYTSIPYNKFYTSALNTYTIVKSVDTVCIWCRCRRCCHFCVVATHYRCVFLISIFFPMYTLLRFSFKKYRLSVRFSVRLVFFILVANNNKNPHLWVNVYIIKWTCAHGISTIDDTTSEMANLLAISGSERMRKHEHRTPRERKHVESIYESELYRTSSKMFSNSIQ